MKREKNVPIFEQSSADRGNRAERKTGNSRRRMRIVVLNSENQGELQHLSSWNPSSRHKRAAATS